MFFRVNLNLRVNQWGQFIKCSRFIQPWTDVQIFSSVGSN